MLLQYGSYATHPIHNDVPHAQWSRYTSSNADTCCWFKCKCPFLFSIHMKGYNCFSCAMLTPTTLGWFLLLTNTICTQWHKITIIVDIRVTLYPPWLKPNLKAWVRWACFLLDHTGRSPLIKVLYANLDHKVDPQTTKTGVATKIINWNTHCWDTK